MDFAPVWAIVRPIGLRLEQGAHDVSRVNSGRSRTAVGGSDASHPTSGGPRWFPAVALASCVASLLVFFRPFVTSGFDLLSGGPGDSRLHITLMEHWIAVFSGRASFTSPPFFFPARDVLGYSDALFLFAPPYAVARLLGLDRYLAFEGTMIAIKAIGFVALYVLLRRTGRVDRWTALLGAGLFTFSNAYYLAIGHGQFIALAFVPGLAVLADAYWRRRTAGRHAPARLCLSGAAVLLALLLFTAYYVAWFTIFVAGLLGLAAFPWIVAALRRLRAADLLVDAAIGAGVFLVALVPFLVVYLPVIRHTGGRSFTEVLLYAAHLPDALNVGPDNLVWGSLLARIVPFTADQSIMARYEVQRGWPPTLLFVFLATIAIALFRTATRRGPRVGGLPSSVPVLLGITAVVAWGSAIEVGGVTPWALIYRAVPGASAIRVPVRINFIVNLLVISVAMIGLTELLAQAAVCTRWARALGWSAVALVLVVEQLNGADVFRLSRSHEASIFDAIPPPPAACRSFYLVRPATADPFETIEAHTEAMLITADRGIPTLNGYSGNVPPRWRLADFDDEYPKHVAAWVTAHRLGRGLCVLDLSSGRWSPAEL